MHSERWIKHDSMPDFIYQHAKARDSAVLRTELSAIQSRLGGLNEHSDDLARARFLAHEINNLRCREILNAQSDPIVPAPKG